MKPIIAGTLLALPFAIASIPTQQASALEVIVNPRVHRAPAPVVISRRVERQRQRWIPGHWERRRNGRVWIPGRYVRY
ncbi:MULTISPECIES: YXWGXW repeat-containing protein [Nostocales]|nr:YXWGXW repeat-containing protein [Tolypothrix bouteillei]